VKSNILKNLLSAIKTNLYKHKTLFKTIPLVLLLIIASVIFFYRITAPSMWVDEMNARSHSNIDRNKAVEMSKANGLSRGMLSYAYFRVNYYSEKLFTNIDFSVRAPEALSALLTLIFVFFLGRHIFSTGVGYISIILLMTNPFFVRYAQENRYYQMGSLCLIACYSFLSFYISTGRRIYLLGLFLFASFYLRCHQFGAIQVPLLIVPMLFLIFISERKKINPKRACIELILTALAVIIVWIPNFLQMLDVHLHYSKATTTKNVDAFFRTQYGYSVDRFLNLTYLVSIDLFRKIGSNTLYIFLVLAVVGSAVYSKWRATILLIYLMLITLPPIYAMNSAHAVIMPKRFLYLLPFITILIVGGVWAAIKLLSEPFNLLFNKILKKYGKYLYYMVYASLTIIAILFLLFPVLKSNMTRTCNNYFKDKEMYKPAAMLISMNWLPGEKTVFTKQADWVLNGYTPRTPNFWRISINSNNKRKILDNFNSGNGIWMLHKSPSTIGIPANEIIEIPLLRGKLYYANQKYKTNPEKKINDYKRLLRNAVVFSTMPEIKCAKKLIELYNKDKQFTDAWDVALKIAQFDLVPNACSFAADFFRKQKQIKRANEIWYKYANMRFWEESAQKRAAKLAFKSSKYKFALKYNFRYKLLTLGKNALNNYELGLIYYHLKNYEKALKLFNEKKEITTSNIVTHADIIEPYLICLKKTGNEAKYISFWLADWDKNKDPSKLYSLYSLLDELIKNKKRLKYVLKKLSEKSPETIPFIEFIKKTVLDNDSENLYQNLLLFKKHAGGGIWPLYTYAVDRFAKNDWKKELELPLSDLVLKFKADQVAKTNMRVANYGWGSKEHPFFIKTNKNQKNLFAQFDVNIALPGKYKLLVSLATTKKYPFDIYVNNKLTLKNVGDVITGSLTTALAKDIEVGIVNLIKGKNTITIKTNTDKLPHITGISLIKL